MRPSAWALGVLLLAAGAACGESGARPEGTSTGSPTSSPTSSPPQAGESPCASPGASPPDGQPTDARDYHPSLFEAAGTAVNEWYPLRPGTRLFYRGSSVDEGQRLHHTVDIIVTDLTKVVDGVESVVVWERDYTEGELVETEVALFATDRYGNVWHPGEYPEEYEEGEFVAAPAWVHGLAGACGGITIPGQPEVGSADYAQGWAPKPISWADRGRVYKVDQRTCVPAGCFDDVVIIEEFEHDIPDAYQDKHYAPGVGVVRVGWRGANDESKEVLELVRVATLDAAGLARVRTQALALEDRAYTISKDVWGRTDRATPR